MRIQKTAGMLLYFLLCALPSGLRAQTAGVGINTENLQGVFHVDAAGNNPSPSGSISPAQQADDVVITEEGYVGIGTLSPTTQLHIHTQNQTGVFPLRIEDGSLGNNQLLVSDDEGIASWQNPPAPPSTTVYSIQTVPTQTFTKGSPTQATNSAFTVPEDGFYSMDVRFWGEAILSSYTLPLITILQLRRNGDLVDQYQYSVCPNPGRITAFVTLYAKASQGEVLSLWVHFVEGSESITANPSPNYEWIKTKVLYKKLVLNDDTHYFD